MHEQSETVQGDDGKWRNVYGKKLPQAGQQLPGTETYSSMEEAIAAAKMRSQNYREQIADELGKTHQ